MAASRSNAVNVLREDAVREGMNRSLYTRCSLELLCHRSRCNSCTACMADALEAGGNPAAASMAVADTSHEDCTCRERAPASEALQRAHLERGEGKSDREREALPLPSARRRICAGEAPLAREGELYGVPASMPDDASGISVSPASQSASPLTGTIWPYLIAPVGLRALPDLAHRSAHDCLVKPHMICSTTFSMKRLIQSGAWQNSPVIPLSPLPCGRDASCRTAPGCSSGVPACCDCRGC